MQLIQFSPLVSLRRSLSGRAWPRAIRNAIISNGQVLGRRPARVGDWLCEMKTGTRSDVAFVRVLGPWPERARCFIGEIDSDTISRNSLTLWRAEKVLAREHQRRGWKQRTAPVESNTSSIFSTSIIRSTKQSVSLCRAIYIARTVSPAKNLFVAAIPAIWTARRPGLPLVLLVKNVLNFRRISWAPVVTLSYRGERRFSGRNKGCGWVVVYDIPPPPLSYELAS